MSSHSKKEVPCCLCPGRGHWIKRNGSDVFVHNGKCISDLPRLSRASYRGDYRSFTHPNEDCPECHRPCFSYPNNGESKVFFDSLGPPWPKHSCADEQATAPLGWRKEGFTPIHILDARPYEKSQTPTVQIKIQIKVLDSGRKLGLKLIGCEHIRRIRSV